MRLTVLYPTLNAEWADEANLRLRRIRNLDVSWVSTEASAFQEDLAEAADSDGPLVLCLDPTFFAGSNVAPRLRWAPILRRIEAGGAGHIGIVLLDSLPLPALLKQASIAEGPGSFRALNQWVIHWLALETGEPVKGTGLKAGFAPDLLESLFEDLVDRASVRTISCTCPPTRTRAAHEFRALARPYFEAVHYVDARHQVVALRDAVVSQIQAEGRTLWILDGYEGAPIQPPADASVLILNAAGGIEIPVETDVPQAHDPIARAAQLIPQIPTLEDQPLPFSTFEFEDILPQLFSRNWLLAERLARKAGAFFRVNHRVAEAIWLYDLLREQAELQGHAGCRQDCENELSWLRAAGPRKKQLLQAEQGSFKF